MKMAGPQGEDILVTIERDLQVALRELLNLDSIPRADVTEEW